MVLEVSAVPSNIYSNHQAVHLSQVKVIAGHPPSNSMVFNLIGTCPAALKVGERYIFFAGMEMQIGLCSVQQFSESTVEGIFHAISILRGEHAAGNVSPPDKMVASKKVAGRLLGAQQGDYFHASVRTEQGIEESFFVEDEICFLALNQKEVLSIEYNEIQRFFPEGNGYYPANIIQSISTGAGNRRWVRNENAAPTLTQWRECAHHLLTLPNDRSE